MPDLPAGLIDVCSRLSAKVDKLVFAPPVHTIYNPLDYARENHELYLRRFAHRGVVLFLGMNPGPFGMAQTGVPFGAIPFVRDWMGISGTVSKPAREHPKRPIEGFACTRVEASGNRLWGFVAENFPAAGDFFERAFIYNYCPLVFMTESGANLTPDKFPKAERDALYAVCDESLAEFVRIMRPAALVGIGAFAEARFQALPQDLTGGKKIMRVLHPSPASPLANKNWAGDFSSALTAEGLWPLPIPLR